MDSVGGCRINSPFVEYTGTVFAQVFMIFLFLTLFFFLFVVKVEREIFQTQLNMIVDSIVQDWGRIVPLIMPLDPTLAEKWRQTLIQSLDDQLQTVDSSRWQSIVDANNNIETNARNILIIFGVLVGAGLLTLVVLRFCLKSVHHFWENLMIIGVIGITELLFLELVIRRYIAVNPNHVKLYILQTIQSAADQLALFQQWEHLER